MCDQVNNWPPSWKCQLLPLNIGFTRYNAHYLVWWTSRPYLVNYLQKVIMDNRNDIRVTVPRMGKVSIIRVLMRKFVSIERQSITKHIFNIVGIFGFDNKNMNFTCYSHQVYALSLTIRQNNNTCHNFDAYR